MAKTKSSKSKSNGDSKSVINRTTPTPSKASSPPSNTTSLLTQATTKLVEGDIEGAVPFAQRALGLLDVNSVEALPALNLLGEIHVELGDIDAARTYFTQAAEIDENGEVEEERGGGAEKFLWLAQLSEEGGRDSVDWFERGASVLRQQIQQLVDEGNAGRKRAEEVAEAVEEKRRKLATALCGVVEVYMTDLSWEADAEARCEALVTEATLVGPGFAEPWQTLASVRISQERLEDAQAALKRSLDVWKDEEPESEKVPDFPTRVSLARLLMEAGMEGEAIEVLERLVGEDDSSVEVWYLGGWGLYILGEKEREKDPNGHKVYWISSRQWLNHSMQLFEQQQYEDERLGEHAKELIANLDNALGGPATGEEESEDEEEEDEDDEMTGV